MRQLYECSNYMKAAIINSKCSQVRQLNESGNYMRIYGIVFTKAFVLHLFSLAELAARFKRTGPTQQCMGTVPD